jgi:hypothetical protein
MALESDTEYESVMNDPYRDDPVWEDCFADAVDVQGGPDDDTTSCSEEEEYFEEGTHVTFPETCVCQKCRFVFFYFRDSSIILLANKPIFL